MFLKAGSLSPTVSVTDIDMNSGIQVPQGRKLAAYCAVIDIDVTGRIQVSQG